MRCDCEVTHARQNKPRINKLPAQTQTQTQFETQCSTSHKAVLLRRKKSLNINRSGQGTENWTREHYDGRGSGGLELPSGSPVYEGVHIHIYKYIYIFIRVFSCRFSQKLKKSKRKWKRAAAHQRRWLRRQLRLALVFVPLFWRLCMGDDSFFLLLH